MNAVMRARAGMGYLLPYNYEPGQAPPIYVPSNITQLNLALGPPPDFDIRKTGSYLAATPAQQLLMLGQAPAAPKGSGVGLQFTKTGLQLSDGTEFKYTTMGIALLALVLIQSKGLKKR